MSWFLLGLILLGGFVLVAQLAARGNPKTIAKIIRYGGGGLAGLIGLGLVLTGRAALAVPFFAIALWLFGRGTRFALPGWAGMGARTRGQKSRVGTDYLDMILDHDSGAMSGTVLKGVFAGRPLDSLSDVELTRLAQECAQDDPDAARLLDAYMARRFGAAGEEAEARARPDRRGAGPMTRDQAYEILGLAPGAPAEDIRRAHRSLMLKLHPDQGGSSYLAVQINQAKDFLLGE